MLPGTQAKRGHKMPRKSEQNALTPLQVKNAKPAAAEYSLSDGGGLSIVVKPMVASAGSIGFPCMASEARYGLAISRMCP